MRADAQHTQNGHHAVLREPAGLLGAVPVGLLVALLLVIAGAISVGLADGPADCSGDATGLCTVESGPRRDTVLLLVTTLPVAGGAAVAGWMAPRSPLVAAILIVLFFCAVCFYPLANVDVEYDPRAGWGFDAYARVITQPQFASLIVAAAILLIVPPVLASITMARFRLARDGARRMTRRQLEARL